MRGEEKRIIKNIVFDLGNVLLEFKPIEYLKDKEFEEDKIKELYEEIFLSKEWPMLDRGVITEEEVINILCERSRNADLIRKAMDNWYEILKPIKESIDILKELKEAGYGLYIISNFHHLAYENVTKRFEFFNYFDGGVISYEEKLLKPEDEIYRKLLQKYNIKAEESVFIDDTLVNIEKSRELGFLGIHFDNPNNLRKKLIDLGVLKNILY
ncbi:putative hydrolase of the HAD superfamily [Clostridium cavendishii DSM 21758]|uniref:Putative hydrolase of the HAD superfamily n=1 Tax=Clostridium cavendishii DSM 21758 TaxID=1121302 RepID=A0A1M6E7M2_9CLOT|nr:putative hydrolase of the HAD superfamily [Clostridium cavendishii DSM 21758]